MKHFKISGFINDNPVLITDSQSLSGAATFEESYSLEKHGKSTLNFKISSNIEDGIANPFMFLIYPRAKIQLEVEDGITDQIIWYIITNISTEFYQNMNIYSITAQDYASTVWAKEGQGLSLTRVGTIEELIKEVLAESRKNLAYKGLIKNYLDFGKYKTYTGAPILTTSSLSRTFSSNATLTIDFNREKEMAQGAYILSFNVLSIPVGINVILYQLDANGTVITNTTSANKTTTGIINIPFTLRTNAAAYRISIQGTNAGYLSIVDWKVKKVEPGTITNSLYLSPLFDIEAFKGSVGDISYYKKVTLSIENSNLYNAFIEIANLFEAIIAPNYVANNVNFLSEEEHFIYKGYRLSPTFNMLSLTREETTDEYSSVLNVRGGEGNFSIFPATPAEWKQYFYDCIKNDFVSPWFDVYTENGYSAAAPYVIANYIPTGTGAEDVSARSKIINDFAKAADRVPNFENTLYSLEYFYNIGRISLAEFNAFNSLVNNDLRKLNIKLKILSEMYQNAQSQLSAKESEIDFYCKNLTVESLTLDELDKKEVLLVDYSDEWIPVQNQIDTVSENIDRLKQQIMIAMNITYDINLVPTGLELDIQATRNILATDSYTLLLLNVLGYYNIFDNGVKQKINEVKDEISRITNLIAERKTRISYLTTQIELETITDFRKREFEVEKSGLEAFIKKSVYDVGIYEVSGDPFNPDIKGALQNKLHYLEWIMAYLSNFAFVPTLVDYSQWVTNDPVEGNWNYVGNVNTVESINQAGITDRMMDISSGSGTIRVSSVALDSTKNYRVSGLFRIAAAASGTISVGVLTKNNYLTKTFTSDPTNARWVAFEYYMKGGATSEFYLFPQEVAFNSAVPTPITYTTGSYTIEFVFSGSGTISLYRPRVEEVTNKMPTLADIYYLYDNPIMKDYNPAIKVNLEETEGLYDLLYNDNYSANINNEKKLLISNMYQDYESLITEGYYENSEEIDSNGLLQQALLAFELSKYPRINYGVSVIDLAALDEWKFLNINIGDKILISPDYPNLYKTYVPQVTQYLQISQIGYDLRNPENTSLTVAEDDETNKILQKLLFKI